MKISLLSCATLLAPASVLATTIAEINGNRFLSPLSGKAVTNVTGLVTAKGPAGIYLRSTTPDDDDSTSESVYVFNGTNRVSPNIAVGDILTLDGNVSEYRSSSTYVYLTEITSSRNIRILSSGNKVKALRIPKDTGNPPTEQFTALDGGDTFGVPNAVANISTTNPNLQPTEYGMDFWESLSGELVTIKAPTAITKPNQYGDTWIRGSWTVTGKNSRGALTMTDGDANPEAIIVGTPLDGTDNPDDGVIGSKLEDITGVIQATFGYYYILPLTALKVKETPSPALPSASKLKSNNKCSGLTVGQYNIENFTPDSDHLDKVTNHIVNFLNSPTIVFVQEIQDNDGSTNDGVVAANTTLTNLVNAIKASGGASYNFTNIDPVNDQDGGEPGGNIRVAYLYNPSVVRLRAGVAGNSTQANSVVAGPHLALNPGLIDPSNAAWQASRKPLVAEWETLDGKNNFFTVNVHWTSKGGSSPIEGDIRPPRNGGIDQRNAQATVTGGFIADILAKDANAAVITAGDFNEFEFVEPIETFESKSGLYNLDDVVGRKPTERYTYLFDMNCQELDHMFVSKRIRSGAKYEHVHVNTWVSFDDAASDHDPSVAKLNVCKPVSAY